MSEPPPPPPPKPRWIPPPKFMTRPSRIHPPSTILNLRRLGTPSHSPPPPDSMLAACGPLSSPPAGGEATLIGKGRGKGWGSLRGRLKLSIDQGWGPGASVTCFARAECGRAFKHIKAHKRHALPRGCTLPPELYPLPTPPHPRPSAPAFQPTPQPGHIQVTARSHPGHIQVTSRSCK